MTHRDWERLEGGGGGGGGGEGNFFLAPRGFGGDIAREPDCAAVTEAKRPPGTSPRTTDRSAYLVRFRPNVSSERYREVSLAVREAPRPGRGEGADDRDSAQVVDVSPRSVLVPSAPGFRTATLWSAWGASTVDEFRGRFDDDVELIEPDFTVTAFQQPDWSSFQQPAYVAAPRRDTQCAYSQANLMPGQWNLDRVDGAAGRALDGYFAPPECLCGKNVFRLRPRHRGSNDARRLQARVEMRRGVELRRGRVRRDRGRPVGPRDARRRHRARRHERRGQVRQPRAGSNPRRCRAR